MTRFKVKRSERQNSCGHTRFMILGVFDGIAIGYCPQCDLLIRMNMYALEEDYYGI